MTLLFNSLWNEKQHLKKGGRSAGKQQVQAPGRRLLFDRRRLWTGKIGKPMPTSRTRVVIKSKFVRNNSDAMRHISDFVEYIYSRERGPFEGERKFFDSERSDVPKSQVNDELQRGKGDEVAAHKMIFAPYENDVDLEKFVREWMKAFEDRLGYQLKWFGVNHENTEHHHSHVTIAGRIPEQTRHLFAKGREGEDVRFSKEGLQLAREIAEEIYYRERGLEKEWLLNREIDREFGHLFDRDSMPRDLMSRVSRRDLRDAGVGNYDQANDEKLYRDLLRDLRKPAGTASENEPEGDADTADPEKSDSRTQDDFVSVDPFARDPDDQAREYGPENSVGISDGQSRGDWREAGGRGDEDEDEFSRRKRDDDERGGR